MCYFITLVVRGSHRAAIAPVVMRHGRRATPIHNPSVESILKPGEAQFLTTVGHCDCGTALGRRAAQVHDQAAKLAKKKMVTIENRKMSLGPEEGRRAAAASGQRRPMVEPCSRPIRIAGRPASWLVAAFLFRQRGDRGV